MTSAFSTANKRVQDLTTLYNSLDELPNRNQWYFEPKYNNNDQCAFVFLHTNTDASARYDSLNMLSNILAQAGIKNSLIAKNGIISDVVISPEYADLARKMFTRYQPNNNSATKKQDLPLEQDWLYQR